MTSPKQPRSFADAVQSLRTATEAADVARKDPAIQASMAAEYEGKVVDLPELRRRNRERDWLARGIPERVWPMLHDGAPDEPVGPLAPKPTPALEAVGRFLSPSERRTFLVLCGAVDSGKTFAAAWGAAWHGGGRVVKALDLLRAGLYPADPGFWPRLHAERLLVVDDLGVEALDGKGYALTTIEDLVDRRYDAARKTIITTNGTPEEIRTRFGPRVWRRLREVGLLVCVKALPQAEGRA